MARGDHIIAPMDACTHHGIDLGDGTVVHWTTGRPGSKQQLGAAARKPLAEIRQTSLAEFAAGRPVWVREYVRCFDSDTVVARALSRVGRRGYDLADNNCEHFACWCKTGRHHSKQVKDVAAAVVGTTGVITAVGAGIGIVSAAGPIAGLGASGTIAGLAAVGRVIGGGPAVGLAGLMAVPAVASALTVQAVLSEEDACGEGERDARAAGRAAGVGSAAVGTASAVGVVAAAGVPGLSTAGIATGLAAIGGGSVGVGLAAMLAFPAVVTLGAGWLAYRLCGGGRDLHGCPNPGAQGGRTSQGAADPGKPR
jgi:hypothetical protein